MSRVNNKEFKRLENDLSLPIEWIQILSAENPPLSLYELSHKATMRDIYDALEYIEFTKFLNIENEQLNKQNESGD